MALSQVQCLDDNHVNPRTHESKPEFLYCEDQRLALEAFLRDGREAFGKYLCAHDLRGFLSDPELETLGELVEPYDPGAELVYPEDAEDDEPPLSLHYWPELSDTSVPRMDLSWPDNISYRGVTRTTVYAQPPLEGQVHIKEVVRKMIAQAQKVIAVVMDVFTDVDIFRDLLDAGFKRKVSVYILLERATLPHFQSMCQRANMHAGHLKNLRVRCTDGSDFYSRSCTKVRGRMGHRFMFIDGDKAVSGSYSFTWMSSRLDKNLITVVTGQAVEAFDRLFRILYATSSSVDLRQVATEPEPELEPLPQPAPVAAPPADIARRMYSPRYAMLALSSPSPVPSPEPKETQNVPDPKNPDAKKGRRRRASKEPVQEDPPVHPGLTDLEKVCMMSYLPTWPEPDPASDVIGFINIRDHTKANQNHLQRSEMFETSQAIRFSSPFSMPKETLPEVAKLRQTAAPHTATDKLQPAPEETKAVVGGAQPAQLNAVPVETGKAEAPGQKPPAPGPKWESDTTETLNAENKRRSNTQGSNAPADQDAGPPSRGTPALPKSNAEREAGTRLNAQRDASYTPHAPQAKTEPASTDSRSQTLRPEPQNSCEITPSAGSPTATNTSSSSTSVSSLSENSRGSVTTSRTTSASPAPSSSSSKTPNPPLTSSPSLTATPPIPKPRTVQLVIKDGAVAGEGQKLPEFSVLRKPETSPGVLDVLALAAAAPTSQEKNMPETTKKVADGAMEIGGDALQKQSGTSREPKTEETDGQRERAAVQLTPGNKAKADVLIPDAPKVERMNIQDVEPKTLMMTDKLTPEIERKAAVRTDINAPGRDSNERRDSESENKTYLARAHVPQRISYSELTPKEAPSLEAVDSVKASKHSEDAQGRPSFTPNAVKHNAQEQIPKAQATAHATDRPLRLHLPDAHPPEFRSPTPEREWRSLSALARTPTPDGLLPRTPTPDSSRTHTPDFRTPDFRTPTSDGYLSPRTDSALSTNSEEYYECSGSPLHELVFDRASSRNAGATEDYVGFTNANAANATSVACTADVGTKDWSAFGSETESSSGPASVSSLSSLKGKMAEENIENGGEEDERGEVDFQRTEMRGGEDAKRRAADHLFYRGEDPTGTDEQNKEAQAPKRKRALNQSAAEKPSVNAGESTNERTGPKRLSTGDLQSGKSSSERKRPDKEKVATAARAALGPSGAERRDTDGQKLLQALPKTPARGQQRDGDASSRPARPPRPVSVTRLGPRPWDGAPPPRRPPSGPPSPATAGRRQDDASRQGRPRAVSPQGQLPVPKPGGAQSQTEEEAHWQDDGKSPFGLTFSRLYSLKGLKGLKDKVGKGGRASSPAPGRKSTS